MHVARVTVIWVSIENPIEQRVDDAPPGAPIDIRRPAARTLSLGDHVNQGVCNRVGGQDGDLSVSHSGGSQLEGVPIQSRVLPTPRSLTNQFQF